MDINILVFTDFREGKEGARMVFLYWFSEYFRVDLKHCVPPAFLGNQEGNKHMAQRIALCDQQGDIPGGERLPPSLLSLQALSIVLQTRHFILRLMLILFG